MDTRDDLPKVHYATALDWFVLMCFGFVIATILEYAGVHYFTKIGSGEIQHETDSEDEKGEREAWRRKEEVGMAWRTEEPWRTSPRHVEGWRGREGWATGSDWRREGVWKHNNCRGVSDWAEDRDPGFKVRTASQNIVNSFNFQSWNVQQLFITSRVYISLNLRIGVSFIDLLMAGSNVCMDIT